MRIGISHKTILTCEQLLEASRVFDNESDDRATRTWKSRTERPTHEGQQMKRYHCAAASAAAALAVSLALFPAPGQAKGCIKGAAVGAVAGHVAGHHAVAGAAAGCVIGHHRAKVKDEQARQQQAAPAH
jgi:hypothetical protein